MKVTTGLVLLLGTFVSSAWAGPGLTLYGRVSGEVGGHMHRLTEGVLQWNWISTNGPPIRLEAELADLGGQFSYVVSIPEEELASIAEGVASEEEVVYDRSDVRMAGRPALIAVGGTSVSLPPEGGPTWQRVDLELSLPSRDTDGDGLPDFWEEQHFESVTAARVAKDDDGDGLTNADEYLGGTHPRDPDSHVMHLIARPLRGLGWEVQWQGLPDRTYRVERSNHPIGSFVTVATNLAIASSRGTFLDGHAAGPNPYFYLVLPEPKPSVEESTP